MPPQKRRHRVGNTFTVLGALAALGIIGGAAGCGGSSAPPSGNGLNSSIAAANASVRASRSAQAAAATPDPKGTYTGSCDYTLGDNPGGNPGTAVATGEVDVVNTGNIGTVDTVTITWPQEGYAPLAMHATVKIAAGATLPVPFHVPLTSAQVDNLQGYQLGHPGEDGCTYGATITDTYGVTS
ncbi:MAG TPA: hypothetical protein VK586_09010 [Streptosporangiaceae bacterium]|nr:hypothetical protein [Streptosporangiaceae bacterium]